MLKTVPTPGDTKWFTHDRFGMFIHWGLYSMAARHEWVQSYESIPKETYESKYFKRFDPDLYDPNLWAETAAGAGMKYFVVTTKHHEGFCLWDSKYTDYKATKSPAKRDLLKPMVQAFRDHDMKVGLYHSLIDWHHEDFIIDDRIGPYRAVTPEERAKMNEKRKRERYAKYLYNQTQELLSKFGKIDVLWYDFSYPSTDGKRDSTKGKSRDDWESEKLMKLIRKLQPHVVLDDRLDLPDGWDVKTPEQAQPREWVKVNGSPVVWEACQTFSGSWGYHRDEQSWRSVDQLVQTLIDCVSKGGNLLLNVGPTGRGEFDERAIDRLKGIGEWMRRHSRSIYGCTQAPEGFVTPQDCRLTYNPVTHRLYVHVFAWPYKHLHIDGLAGKVEYGQLLHDSSEIGLGMDHWHAGQIGSKAETLTISLPHEKPRVTVPVIELWLKK